MYKENNGSRRTRLTIGHENAGMPTGLDLAMSHSTYGDHAFNSTRCYNLSQGLKVDREVLLLEPILE